MSRTSFLRAHRRHQKRYMPDTCAIYERSLDDDDTGGDEETWTLIGTSKCRLAPTAGGGSLLGLEATGLIETAETFDVTLPIGTVVSLSNRLDYTNLESNQMTEFRVIGNDERGSFASAKRVVCKREPQRES